MPCYIQCARFAYAPRGKQVVKVILHETAPLPQMDNGSIVSAKWRQCAFPCGHIGATWRICAFLPSAHPSPQTKQQIDQFSCSCTAHSRKSLYLQWALLSSKIAILIRISGPPSNTWFPAPSRVLTSTDNSIGSATFAQTTAECPYTLQWDAPSPLKIAPAHRRIWTTI